LVTSLGGTQHATCWTDDQTYNVTIYFIAKRVRCSKPTGPMKPQSRHNTMEQK
jgi:hypothetical protein